jgi:hypothetical protein
LAFSETQKDKIRQYLGFAAGYYQYNTPLESMMDKVGLSTVEQASVEAIMAELVTVDAALAAQAATGFSSGGLKQVDKGDVEWFNYAESGGSEVLMPPKQRGKMLVARLAKRFGYTIAELLNQDCSPWYFELGGRGGAMALG